LAVIKGNRPGLIGIPHAVQWDIRRQYSQEPIRTKEKIYVLIVSMMRFEFIQGVPHGIIPEYCAGFDGIMH